MIPKLIPKPGRAVCIGIVPIKPILFLDYDKEYFVTDTPLDYLISFARHMHPFRFELSENQNHFQIFKTKGGYHLVQNLPTYREVRQRLLEFKRHTEIKYEMDPKEIRLRVSPKFKYETGRIMSRAPKLIYSCFGTDHKDNRNIVPDLRFSNRTKREYYFTLKM